MGVYALLYEKKISSFPKMISEAGILDPDAGIRTTGKLSSRKCFVFVTKSAGVFTTALYSVKSVKKESLPDKRLLVKEFVSLPELEKFLSEVIDKPVKAFAY
jgi:hypothetical protein